MEGTGSKRSSFLCVAIDSACEEIHRAWRSGATPLFIAVSPELFAELRVLQRRELLADAPLLLLELPVSEDPSLTQSDVIVARSPVVDEKSVVPS